jgi:hypothetical protein
MKMIFSSGTPLSLSTSTALIAEPPVANSDKTHEPRSLASIERMRTEHGVQQQHIAGRDVIW